MDIRAAVSRGALWARLYTVDADCGLSTRSSFWFDSARLLRRRRRREMVVHARSARMASAAAGAGVRLAHARG